MEEGRPFFHALESVTYVPVHLSSMSPDKTLSTSRVRCRHSVDTKTSGCIPASKRLGRGTSPYERYRQLFVLDVYLNLNPGIETRIRRSGSRLR